MNTPTNVQLALHKQRVLLVELGKKFWATENNIAAQLTYYKVPMCRSSESTEVSALSNFLALPPDRFRDELASPLWPIFSTPMLSRTLSVPAGILSNPYFQQRLPEPILVGISKMYRGAEIELLFSLRSSRISVRDFRRSRQLANSQVAWLVAEQILPFPSLFGGIVPAWDVAQIENYQSLPQISKLQADRDIPRISEGALLTDRDVTRYAKIAADEFVRCALDDKIGFCLLGEESEWGWPQHCVDHEVKSSPYLSSAPFYLPN